MIGPQLALAAMLLYLLLLFGIARFADRQKLAGRSIVANPYVYALSLCVYVSTWTFYGSIGRAASSGLEFLPIYLGPTLAMTVGWIVIRKMIRASKEHRLTSISDFISFRYGRSYAIGAVVAAFSLIVVTPYVALQLIAISTSLEILSGGEEIVLLGVNLESKLIVAILLGAFAVIFGARHLDPMERHEGLIAVVAFESLVKIVAFLIVGLYVTYGVFEGYGSITGRILNLAAGDPAYANLMDVEPVLWFSLTLVSFFAILFLPRQFHVMVVENSSEEHLRKAMWLFPLYLLLINIFVPAIAWGGLLLNVGGLEDAFILTIPHSLGTDWLSLFVFIGGVSAATAMILVESVAVGTMLLNDLEMPYILSHIGREKNLARTILNTRRLNILLVVLLGYMFSLALAYQTLADIGVVSFIAASQLAPAALGGLYWRRCSRRGAMAGLVSGFLLWAYTALLPTMAKGYPWLGDIVREGPWDIKALIPTNLLGLDLDIWTNSAFWTLLVNCSLYVLVSLASKPGPGEERSAGCFVDAFQEKHADLKGEAEKPAVQGTLQDLEAALAHYIGEGPARQQVDGYLQLMGTSREAINPVQLQMLWQQFEKTLTGLMGSSATKMIVEDHIAVKPVVEAAKETMPAYDLVRGKIYVAPDIAYEVFTDQITHGVEGLCITHSAPEDVRRRWGFKETPIIKLSEEKGSDRYVSPRNLPLLFMTIKSFVESSKNSIVLIDSIEQILMENEGRSPPREVLDFVYQLELLGHKTHLVLAERPQFVHEELVSPINEIKELLFSLGPLSGYLFRTFAEAMLSRLEDSVRREVVAEANESIASGEFFEKGRGPFSDDATSACEPEMKEAVGSSLEINIPADLVLTRRSFFIIVRRLGRIIKEHQTSFDPTASLAEIMKSYGRSPHEITLIPGTTYIIAEEKPQQSLELYSDLVRHGMDGLCLSRYNPSTLSERYNVPIDSVIWLTQKSEPGYRTVDPSNFPRLSSMISDFLEKARYPLILLEGMGYLITQSNYETVLRFVQSQRDEIALKSAIMLVHIDPLSLDTKELHRLGSEMEPLKI